MMTLVNDLDLQVVVNASSQGQAVHYGNGYPDNINNIEQVSSKQARMGWIFT